MRRNLSATAAPMFQGAARQHQRFYTEGRKLWIEGCGRCSPPGCGQRHNRVCSVTAASRLREMTQGWHPAALSNTNIQRDGELRTGIQTTVTPGANYQIQRGLHNYYIWVTSFYFRPSWHCVGLRQGEAFRDIRSVRNFLRASALCRWGTSARGPSVNIERTANPSTNQFINLKQGRPATPEAVLEELFRLLEEYGPSWYTEEHHNRAVAALFERSW